MTTAISASGLVKTFGQTRALDGLDLTVATGEVHGFLGPNGSGKSTTIRALLGLLRADAGTSVLLDGDPWHDAVALHRRLAYVPGDVNLWPKLRASGMTELTGTATLVRLILRRDRFPIVLWVGGIALLVLLTAASVEGLYPTQHDLDVAAHASQDNPAAIAFNGPDQALDTVGGQVAFNVGSFGLIMVALMSLFTVSRNTRADEEAGRTELLRATVVGRHAPATAALLVVVGMNLSLVAPVILMAVATGLATTGLATFRRRDVG